MARPQPYRIDWTVEPESLEDCSQRLGTQFESIDQMFQMLFEDVQTLENSITDQTAAAATVVTGAQMAQILLRVFLRG